MRNTSINSQLLISLEIVIFIVAAICSTGSGFRHGGGGGGELAYDYYKSSCPYVEDIVRQQVFSIISTDATASAAFLRLLFHDCQVQGCDASILLDSAGSEIYSSRNFGISKREAIGQIKSTLEVMCPGQVSCADILALAARDSVAFTGGPRIQIPLGRKDSRTSSSRQADIHLPSSKINVDTLFDIFMTKGLHLEESVAMLGAHTLGVGHCINIVNRLYDPKPTDNMDSSFELFLKLQCPSKRPFTNLTVLANDATPTLFDNQYYRDIAMGRGLFGVDSSISNDPRTASTVEKFTSDQDHFFRAFSSGFVKLSSSNVLTEARGGEVRLMCNQVN